jgi:hypothetical protein
MNLSMPATFIKFFWKDSSTLTDSGQSPIPVLGFIRYEDRGSPSN